MVSMRGLFIRVNIHQCGMFAQTYQITTRKWRFKYLNNIYFTYIFCAFCYNSCVRTSLPLMFSIIKKNTENLIVIY